MAGWCRDRSCFPRAFEASACPWARRASRRARAGRCRLRSALPAQPVCRRSRRTSGMPSRAANGKTPAKTGVSPMRVSGRLLPSPSADRGRLGVGCFDGPGRHQPFDLRDSRRSARCTCRPGPCRTRRGRPRRVRRPSSPEGLAARRALERLRRKLVGARSRMLPG